MLTQAEVGTKRLPAVLSPWQALGVIVGGTIGASIFLVPTVIAQRVPYLAGALAIWVVGAAITLASVCNGRMMCSNNSDTTNIHAIAIVGNAIH